jgi:hypothetical protein
VGIQRAQEKQRAGNVRWGLGGRGVVVQERGCILDCIRIGTSTSTLTHLLINSITAKGMAPIPLFQTLSPA